MQTNASPGTLGRTFGGTLKQLGLALLNATLILVIVAALAIGWAANSALTFSEQAAQRVTASVLAASGIQPAQWQRELGRLNTSLAALKDGSGFNPALRGELSTISGQLKSIDQTLKAIRNPQERVGERFFDSVLAGLDQSIRKARGVLNEEPKAAERTTPSVPADDAPSQNIAPPPYLPQNQQGDPHVQPPL
ncbi:hypothetical protein E1162_14270 [Rhodobacteraceae bacterium RKSG542]|uniref:hypothetical protein n=1 Tax=Pseudovibrio flavus TaxID=2529854 RepID=UPI0012BD18E1|nr:hypothetical protein [Pseudovibrio flavus]MTI18406.1 hypothetical protein [Pseudovibrio flavus]